ncbi:MAG TPA: peptidoglycan-binding domain-containing protein [Gemmatimonadales bacterium]|nr:peptidoglycan-binding domain-containing protein [Gemmatimonadales bacterium]
MQFIRELRRGMRGPDVLAVKRALKKAGLRKGLTLNPTFGTALEKQLKVFQHKHKLVVDGHYGPKTHAALLKYFDAYGRLLYKRTPRRSEEDQRFDRLIAVMRKMTMDTPGYQLGGGHGIKLWDVSTRQKLDCSSSCSKALFEVGMFPEDVAWVSGTYAWRYGDPGTGKYFTVYANGEHVWIRLHRSIYWRFDTSPHGDGGRGPRLRFLPRFTSGFAARHWRGM